MTAPTVSVTLPAGDYDAVARLLSAGYASRLNLPFSAIDDLQLAVDLVLRSAFRPGEQATLTFRDDGPALMLAISPVSEQALQRPYAYEADADANLGSLLARLVDSVTAETEPVATVVLRKERAASQP